MIFAFHWLQFCVILMPMHLERRRRLAESFINRADNKIDEARSYLKNFRFPESISAAQECIELSVKAIFLLLGHEYPKKHEFEEKDFERILESLPKNLNYLKIPCLYLYSRFWSSFYTVAKYGLERLGVGPEELFDRPEAELAIKHAEKCLSTARTLRDLLISQLISQKMKEE